MDKFACLTVIICCSVLVLGYGLYQVKIRGFKLRRTANLDIALLETEPEKRKVLEQALNGFIMIEAAFASVTSGILFIFVGLFATGSAHLETPDREITHAAAASLGIATISWILSLEQLSHMVSPSLNDRVFCNLYKEAFNLWNLGLILLIFSVSCVLLLVDSLVALGVTVLSTTLTMRSLYLVHGWDERSMARSTRPKTMPDRQVPASPTRSPWLTLSLAALALLLFPLYGPLNVSRIPLHNLGTRLDAAIPFWPVFVVPYLSYFLILATTVLYLTLKKDRIALDRFLLATVLTLSIAYIIYGFWQTEVPRPDLTDTTGWATTLMKLVYGNDKPFNAFPSLHTALSVVCAWSVARHKQIRVWWAAWALLIMASTLFVKQHFIADMLGGSLLATAAFALSVRAFPVFKRTQN